MKKKHLLGLIYKYDIPIGSRIWDSTGAVERDSDYDIVIPNTLNQFIKPDLEAVVTENYETVISLQTKDRYYFTHKGKQYNIIVVKQSDMKLYQHRVDIIAKKMLAKWYHDILRTRDGRKAIMQSILLTLRESK